MSLVCALFFCAVPHRLCDSWSLLKNPSCFLYSVLWYLPNLIKKISSVLFCSVVAHKPDEKSLLFALFCSTWWKIPSVLFYCVVPFKPDEKYYLFCSVLFCGASWLARNVSFTCNLFCSVMPRKLSKNHLFLLLLWSVLFSDVSWSWTFKNICLVCALFFTLLPYQVLKSVSFFFHFSFVCCCVLAAVAQLSFHTYWSLNINYIEICAHSRLLGVAEGSFTVKPSLPGIYHLFFCDAHQEPLYSSSVFNLSCEGITRTLWMTAI